VTNLSKYKNKTIVFCLPGDYYSGTFLSNMLGLTSVLNHHKINTFVAQNSGSCIHRLREVCSGASQENGIYQTPFSTQEIEYDYLMWIDSDIVFNRDNFERLLEADKDVVTGWYVDINQYPAFGFLHKKEKKYGRKKQPFPLYDKDNLYAFRNDFQVEGKTEMYKIDWVGMGWMLIKKGVMEKIPYPWFSPKFVRILGKNEGEESITSLSEDISFQLSLKEAGIDIWLDPLIRVGHEKVRVL